MPNSVTVAMSLKESRSIIFGLYKDIAVCIVFASLGVFLIKSSHAAILGYISYFLAIPLVIIAACTSVTETVQKWKSKEVCWSVGLTTFVYVLFSIVFFTVGLVKSINDFLHFL